MQFLNRLANKKLAKIVLGSIVAAGCVVGFVNNASAESYIGPNAKKYDLGKGFAIWIADKDKISVINSSSKPAGYQAYDDNMVLGGYQVSGESVISGKTVDVNGVKVEQDVAGGFGDTAKVEKNTVIINNAELECDVYGGESNEGVVSDNQVKLTKSSFGQEIYGGFSDSKAAKGNTVTMVGSTVAGTVYGGYSEANAAGNSVSIADSKLGTTVYGGYSDCGHATDNNVTLTDSTLSFPGMVYGGYTGNFADGQDNKIVKTDVNTVTIKFSKTNDTINSVFGGSGPASAQNNKVFVIGNGDSKISSMVGGRVSGKGVASNNLVVLKNITVENVYGGDVASKEAGTANNNIVVIADSDVSVAYGGNGSNEATSKDNTVVLVGNNGSYDLVSQDGKYKDVVKGTKNTKIGSVAGAMLGTQSGNTLDVYGYDTTVGNVANFQKLQFTMAAGNNKDKNLLLIASEQNADTVLNNVEYIAVTAVPGANLAKDAKVNLIHKTDSGALKLLAGAEDSTSIFDENGRVKSDYANIAVVSSPLKATSGEIFKDKLDSDAKMNDLVFIAKENISVNANDELADNAKSTVETRANAAALLNEGADFIMGQGLAQAKAAAKAGAVSGSGKLTPFAAIGGGNMRYNTGSHVDSKSWHGAIGLSKQASDLVYGVAVEHGKSNYDSYVGDAHSEGKSKATGGTVFAELKKDSGVHYDTAVRVGRINNDYSAELSLMGVSQNMNYEEKSTYYGLSIGGGKEFKLNDKDVADVYGRYYWTHTNSAAVTTNLGDKLSFDAINSHRLRLGSRYTHAANDMNKLYAGLAWQYEFSGEARATVNDGSAPAPSLKGHSCMLELGWKVETGKKLDIDLNMSGWTGKQRGVMGGINMQWKF